MIGDRKNDHVRFAVDQQRDGTGCNDFDAVSFVHHALAGIDCADISLGATIAGRHWAAPLYINAMTGGNAATGDINRQLAIAAHETGLAIASGSMSAYLRDESVADTYQVLRRENPHGFVMANVNANATATQAQRAIELVEADALQIHLNAVQEIVMPEGDRSFRHWPAHIEEIVRAVSLPVIVKEVGFGLSRPTVDWLRGIGVAGADIGGRGGTNFAHIENNRGAVADYSFLTEWGQSTACCLLDLECVAGIDILASGGIRSPLDVARALALGARAAGVAGRFLHILVDQGTDALITTINAWLKQLRQIMTVLGAATPGELTRCDLLLTGALQTHCQVSGIDASAYTRRAQHMTIESDSSAMRFTDCASNTERESMFQRWNGGDTA
ncbi:type 2 isopentenyl-diphosphate Delta-isomerase [Nocardia sp. NPDC050408]|uniref:type 2 isopentenyl-diphosphate Delta-isomerase n=1 Tax=Nocardia sp. NPDC050408 TaxID=3364319 RepID=UPI0037B01BA6